MIIGGPEENDIVVVSEKPGEAEGCEHYYAWMKEVHLLETLRVEVGVCTVEGEDSVVKVVVMLGIRLVNGSIVMIGGEEDIEGKNVTSIVITEMEIGIGASLSIRITSSRW
jgi:hypothetical protein